MQNLFTEMIMQKEITNQDFTFDTLVIFQKKIKARETFLKCPIAF